MMEAPLLPVETGLQITGRRRSRPSVCLFLLKFFVFVALRARDHRFLFVRRKKKVGE
jgi:hypothetical protein